jgi:Na+/H+-dicarboxylate symporter
MEWYKKLHWQIIIGLIAGILWGLVAVSLGMGEASINYIKPWGTIFIRLLQLVAVPLVLASLIMGIASLNDIAKLSRIGGKTMTVYIGTTVLAISIGLVMANYIEPGLSLPVDTREDLMTSYKSTLDANADAVELVKNQRPLDPLVQSVPDNIFKAASANTNMLQVVFFAVLFGAAIVLLKSEKSQHLISFFDALNDVVVKIVDMIMKMAPIGVFALISSLIIDLTGRDTGKALQLLTALGWYAATLLLGLFIHLVIIYGALVRFGGKIKIRTFFSKVRPVMLLGFSTSSSNATLPLTMETVEKELKVHEEVSSFVLPLGATINMDGTSMYQAVAAVFIAQALGMDLTFADQISIVLTATLASIGSAGIPGAGLVMLVIVLQAIHVPIEGIALIMGIDRLMDMFRTAVNITGDMAVATAIARSEKRIDLPPV